MKKIRGFLLKHRVNTFFRRLFRRNRSSARYRRLGPPPSWTAKPIRTFLSWGHRLGTKSKAMICSNDPDPGYWYDGEREAGRVTKKTPPVPKGHLAVYVGQKDGDYRRALVPVIYINHPLFGELLREAEEEYGFNQPGGITIPCRISEFESVQTRIKEGRDSGKVLRWKRYL